MADDISSVYHDLSYGPVLRLRTATQAIPVRLMAATG